VKILRIDIFVYFSSGFTTKKPWAQTSDRRVVLIDFNHADPDFHNADEEDRKLENCSNKRQM